MIISYDLIPISMSLCVCFCFGIVGPGTAVLSIRFRVLLTSGFENHLFHVIRDGVMCDNS